MSLFQQTIYGSVAYTQVDLEGKCIGVHSSEEVPAYDIISYWLAPSMAHMLIPTPTYVVYPAA